MVAFLFFFFALLVTVGMCVLAAWSDFKGFRIPNSVSLVILAAFVLAYGADFLAGKSGVFSSPSSHLGTAAAFLVVTGILFVLKQLGAGDSKFGTVVALWAGLSGLVPFLFYMALSGGIIAAVSLALRKWKPFSKLPEGSWPAKAQEGNPSVPYGIAIAIGAIAAFFSLGYFSPEKWAGFFEGGAGL